jgi:acetyl esterase/lipase
MTSPYAAPGRASDLSSLPPAVIVVNERDPLRDEGIEYACRLMAAGISVELYCAARQYHGGPSLDSAVQMQAVSLFNDAIRRFLS